MDQQKCTPYESWAITVRSLHEDTVLSITGQGQVEPAIISPMLSLNTISFPYVYRCHREINQPDSDFRILYSRPRIASQKEAILPIGGSDTNTPVRSHLEVGGLQSVVGDFRLQARLERLRVHTSQD